MELIIGFLGALLALGLFVTGVVVGWKLKAYDEKKTQKVTAEALTAEQKQRVKDEREAWNCLHNYSAADAYGMNYKKPEVSE